MSTANGNRFHSESARWEAVCRRDPAADGHFYYSVRTTGVYCRPSCSSRRARAENVVFHATATDAEKAGFRPCLRCRPDAPPRPEREALLVARACRAIEAAEQAPRLRDLAAQCGLSERNFHRVFKRVTGVTPKSYALAHRQSELKKMLTRCSSVTEAMYESGFSSSGRFYESGAPALGMTPSAWRKGGAGEDIWHAAGRCSLGRVLVAATRRGICAIFLGDNEEQLLRELRLRFAHARLCAPPSGFADCLRKVVRYVDNPGRDASLDLPLDIRGTVFQRRVWEALCTIPSGKTLSYSQLALLLGKPRAARAVAAACAANSLAVAVPCHRAVASNGSIAGYRWGLERKRHLIEREK